MKSLVIALGALALSVALTVSAAAQEATRQADEKPIAAQASTPQPPSLPLAEAKKRFRAMEDDLQNLVRSGGLESVKVHFLREDQILFKTEQPRNRLRAAVAGTFDARRQVQQGELAELEARVARIKRAMEIRDAMRETLIDQRTDELLDQIEEQRAKTGQSDGTIVEQPNATKGAATAPAKRRTLEIIDAEIGFKEAEANLLAAKRLYDYAKKMSAKGYVTNDDVREKAANYERANLKLERERQKLKLAGGAPGDNTPATHKTPAESLAEEGAANPSAGIDVDAIDRKRLLELAADEAIANFESAERAYRRLEKLRASGAIEQAVLDEQIEKLALARIQFERAAVKAALGVEEAEANLESAERALKRAEKLQASGAIEQSVLDQHLDQYNHATIQLDRAESNADMFDRVEKRLEALDRGPSAAGAVSDPKKASFDQPGAADRLGPQGQ